MGFRSLRHRSPLQLVQRAWEFIPGCYVETSLEMHGGTRLRQRARDLQEFQQGLVSWKSEGRYMGRLVVWLHETRPVAGPACRKKLGHKA